MKRLLALLDNDTAVGPEARKSATTRFVATVIAVFAGYYFGAKFGFALKFESHPISVLWPPNSILAAALLLTQPRRWRLILLSAFPAHWAVQLQGQVPPAMSLCWFVSNCCEALIGAAVARRLIVGPVHLTSIRNIGIFCLSVGFLGPLLSSFVDAAFVRWNEFGQGSYWELWWIRSTSNVLAALTIAPFIINWATIDLSRFRVAGWKRQSEALLLFASLVAVSFAVLIDLEARLDVTLLYLPLPFLIWSAVRFGSCGASTAMAIVTLSAIWSAGHGYGPFSNGTPEQDALAIQVFLIVMALPIMFLAASIDDRLRVERELREREERVNLATESANLSLWVYNPDSDSFWMSEKGKGILGICPQLPLTRQSFIASIHPEDRASVMPIFEPPPDNAKNFEIAHRMGTNSDIRWAITRGRHLGEKDGDRELIGVTIDVTPQKRADFQIQAHREEMAHLSRVAVMGQMAISLAHELTQPLTGMVSNADAGRRILEHSRINRKNFRELLADISADGQRAGNVIHGIRGMVKKDPAVRKPADINRLVETLVQIVSPEAALRSCEIKTKLAQGLPMVECNPIEIQQVLLNLVLNAFQAMSTTVPRKLTITTRLNQAGLIEIAVRDCGTGLSESARQNLFQQFFTTKSDGLGMGLAIARSIIDSHNGTIAAENVSTGGAEFRITLPAVSSRPGQAVFQSSLGQTYSVPPKRSA